MKLKLFNTTIYIKKEVLIVIILFIILILSLLGYSISKKENEIVIYAESSVKKEGIDLKSKTASGEEINPEGGLNEGDNGDGAKEKDSKNCEEEGKHEGYKDDKGEDIKVYIVGCVNNPGIKTLKKGQMIYEAIEAAGGVTEKADVENINMVYRLEGNTMLNILQKDRDKNIESDLTEKTGIEIIDYEGESVICVGEVLEEKDSSDGTNGNIKININTASAPELETLPGIGVITAENIITYRQQYGNFGKIEDVMNVPGIKENKFSKIRELIKVN